MPKNSKSTVFGRKINHFRKRVDAYLERRSHRSFRLTRRRDYIRPLQITGYVSLTAEVSLVLWRAKRVFFGLAAIYCLLSIVLIGLGSQTSYDTLVTTLRDTSGDAFDGVWGSVSQAGLLFASLATGGLSSFETLAVEQIIYTVILLLFIWLTSLWLLRQALADKRLVLREALYNAGGPILPTFLLAFVFALQLIPLALAFIAYGAASASGLLEGGVEAMLFWGAIILTGSLTLYWGVSTFFAMVVVTLPGTYPMHALRVAGDMVAGRRVKIFMRLLWAMFVVGIVWALILIPTILFDGWLKSVWPAVSWLPIVPFALLLLTVAGMIWTTAYVYILYRKVIDSDAA